MPQIKGGENKMPVPAVLWYMLYGWNLEHQAIHYWFVEILTQHPISYWKLHALDDDQENFVNSSMTPSTGISTVTFFFPSSKLLFFWVDNLFFARWLNGQRRSPFHPHRHLFMMSLLWEFHPSSLSWHEYRTMEYFWYHGNGWDFNQSYGNSKFQMSANWQVKAN